MSKYIVKEEQKECLPQALRSKKFTISIENVEHTVEVDLKN